ncbi:Uncharacterized protein conserved in bacteria [Legionella steigerwaltii]|uniref:Uncharacterized protein conserved in bacteria n=1 Tax=Legionella steigerwaltii TaxID=460 RepID=A0A378LD36_9GAMM|nr:poly(ADP-ribose) glycohydrolase domain-containing protein [Legionella steigerwaltii]KTD79548.1 hypothetical protein Lstg_0764 [Legionella steigerwaltii]STY24567.1 Uncharacterized protein conserved in bacteria [Legionella steigerwaltii]
MLSRQMFGRIPKSPALIKEVHAAHKPSFVRGSLSGERWRHKSMGRTLEYIIDPNKLIELHKQAQFNLSEWAKKRILPPKSVEVVPKDWGIATLEATKKHGRPYAVLNMANSVFPGGASLEGGSAQEENMWHRSTCVLSLLDKMVYLDKETMTFRYNNTARKLLEAKIKMTDKECDVLKQHGGETDPIAYKVLFNPKSSVCFRGPEVTSITSGFEEFHPDRPIADSTLSYSFLHPSSIFPFFELRSAAPEFVIEPHALAPKELAQYTADLRRRIAAQLDTLILEGKTHVILGAWGCGAFKNDPTIVAQIYHEEIEKRAHFFDHIVFPILNTGSHDNYTVFDDCLDGMKLGSTTPTLGNL